VSERLTPPYIDLHERGSYDTDELDALEAAASKCVPWWGPMHPEGYGEVRRRRHRELAHRMIYRESFGAIPAGYVVHHRCGVRACVNPEHLELLSPGDHSRLHDALTPVNARRRAATHCKYGHEFTEENTHRESGRRVCRSCSARRQREYRERTTA
jgi:hypothetical protein